MYVYVLNINGKPLMPTTRCGHIRILLKSRKAKVVGVKPFTVQLLYEVDNKTQDLCLGIDPGRTNIGVSAVSEDGKPVFEAQVETRNKDIPKLMQKRKAYRMQHRHLKRRCKRQRRAVAADTVKAESFSRVLPGCEEPITCHYIKNKEARFNNRKRPEGWLTPTANHLLQTHLNLINKISKILPITDVVVEINRFSFMALDNPNIQKWQYQRGPLYNKGSVEQAVYEMQDGHCIFCNCAIEHYHHVIPKNNGGSDVLSNRAGLCEKHHILVHTKKEWQDKLANKVTGLMKKYHALSVLNQIIPYLLDELGKQYTVYATTGQDTAEYRRTHNIPKNHYLDAYCIANSVLDKHCDSTKHTPYLIKQFRRQDRQACHKENVKRIYLLDGVAVATNRHKSIEQFDDSLEEFRNAHTEQDISKLTVKEHNPQYKDMHRPMPGSKFVFENQEHILLRSQGKHNGKTDYYIDVHGNKYRANKCKFVANNSGLCFI